MKSKHFIGLGISDTEISRTFFFLFSGLQRGGKDQHGTIYGKNTTVICSL